MTDTIKSLDEVERLISRFMMKLSDNDNFADYLGIVMDLNDMRSILREDLAKELSEVNERS